MTPALVTETAKRFGAVHRALLRKLSALQQRTGRRDEEFGGAAAVAASQFFPRLYLCAIADPSPSCIV